MKICLNFNGRTYASLFVYRIEFKKTRWSCLWHSDQNCTQNSARGWFVVKGGIQDGISADIVEFSGIEMICDIFQSSEILKCILGD